METEELVSELRRAARALVRELGVVGSRYPNVPCTVTEGNLLLELELDPGLRVVELAERLVLDKSTTSRALTGLVQRRLVTVSPDPGDRRRKLFALTRTGRRMVGRLHATADSQVREALAWLEPGEPDEVLSATKRYARALRKARQARGYEIREIRRQDNLQLLGLLRDVRTEHVAIVGDNVALIEPDEHDLHTLYAGDDRCYLVIERQGRILGGGGFSPLAGGEPGWCELQRMYLRPEVRGMGLGFQLLSRCLRRAKACGFTDCYLETMAGLQRANRLYEKAGFS
ncbi:MAG: bifunctional helix-turn-helix transcriptional regulator/GNAT family N-acetyltransferase, partial [Gammaproteobacteria bacterium]